MDLRSHALRITGSESVDRKNPVVGTSASRKALADPRTEKTNTIVM
jgi:hypothetical protein